MKNVFIAVVVMLSLSLRLSGAEELLLSQFSFNGNGNDDLHNSPSMELANAFVTNGVLVLPEDPSVGWYWAHGRIPDLSYDSFTVAVDFMPLDFRLYRHSTILVGGTSYRWLALGNDALGHLNLTLNNWGLTYSFTNVIQSNQWHTLVCAVDIPSQSIVIYLDGKQLQRILLNGFQFNVVGTPEEEWDKEFSFYNFGNASCLYGYADNLRVYRRALSATEIGELLVTPNVTVQAFPRGILIHWPTSALDCSLESTSSLLPPVFWAKDNRMPIIVGDQNVLVDTPCVGNRFYRLTKQ